MRNKIREKVEKEIPLYNGDRNKANHAGFYLDASFFEKSKEEGSADFKELLIIVEKSWLFRLMRKSRIRYPELYLTKAYTPEDAVKWYKAACKEQKIVSVRFLQ